MRFGIVALGLVAACAGAGPSSVPRPAPNAVEITMFLIGDAGAPAPGGEPVLKALSAELAKAPGQRVVVFLGDNVYPRGLPDSGAPDRAEMERRLDTQVDLVKAAGARGIFVPGNHDWAKHGPDGWNAMRRQGRQIARRGAPEVELLPVDGCPGPAVVDFGERVRLIALDTQWWLHGGPRPVGPESKCRAANERAVADSLKADLASAGKRTVLVAAHHPLASGGEHGGYFGVQSYLFPLRLVKPWLWIPLPGVGSTYPIARQSGVTNQDMAGIVNQRMREMLQRAMRDHPPLVWADGHDHNLQVLKGLSARWLLVSGAGIFGHEGPVNRLPETRFASQDAGFMRVEFLTDGRERLGVLAVDQEGRSLERFSAWLE
jgi:Calcineurin-like phosphoesterase